MGLHQTLQQILEAREGNAAAAASATESAAQMRQHERRTAALVDRLERAAARAKWERVLDGALGGLITGVLLIAAAALWLWLQ